MFNMQLDAKTYAIILTSAKQIANKYGIDAQTAEDITQEVALILCKTLQDEEKVRQLRNWITYTRSIIRNKFMDHLREKKKKRIDAEDLDWIDTSFDMSLDMLIDNQASCLTAVGDYIRKNPKCLSRQNHTLWRLFEEQPHLGVPDIMQQLGIKKTTTYYTAKARLLARLIAIWEHIKQQVPELQ